MSILFHSLFLYAFLRVLTFDSNMTFWLTLTKSFLLIYFFLWFSETETYAESKAVLMA